MNINSIVTGVLVIFAVVADVYLEIHGKAVPSIIILAVGFGARHFLGDSSITTPTKAV